MHPLEVVEQSDGALAIVEGQVEDVGKKGELFMIDVTAIDRHRQQHAHVTATYEASLTAVGSSSIASGKLLSELPALGGMLSIAACSGSMMASL